MKMTYQLAIMLWVVQIIVAHLKVCYFDEELFGDWFQSDQRGQLPVVVNGTHFNGGRCVQIGKTNRYLVHMEQEDCYKCMVINMKHANVIQYKESFCYAHQSDLATICHDITGDAILYSMFRLNAAPIQCPFTGPLTFSYSKGYGECNSPISQVDSCSDHSRLLFRQQACPDIPKSESKEEELICLAIWSEGSNHYLAGKIDHKHAQRDEDKYRCFIYDQPGHHRRRPGLTLDNQFEPNDIWHLAVSADATCQGLVSAYEGSKTLKMRKAKHLKKKCTLPSWLSNHKTWYTLDYSEAYRVHHHNTSINVRRSTGEGIMAQESAENEVRLHCYEYRGPAHKDRDVTITMHYSANCRSGYKCMRILHRGPHTLQLLFGKEAITAEEACGPHFWDADSREFVTLLSHVEHSGSCGLRGRYHIPSIDDIKSCEQVEETFSFHKLSVGCSSHNTLQIHRRCFPQLSETYQCHSQWESEGNTYVVAAPVSRASTSPRRVCFAYIQASGNGVVIVSRRDTCISKQQDPHMIFNATLTGQCGITETSTATSLGSPMKLLWFWFLASRTLY